MASMFRVTAIWDEEARVFTSETDIPGLVVEADTFEEFVSLVETLAPDVLQANMPGATRPFHFNIDSHRVLAVA